MLAKKIYIGYIYIYIAPLVFYVSVLFYSTCKISCLHTIFLAYFNVIAIYVVDDETTKGKKENSYINNINTSDTPQYDQLKTLSVNLGPTYEQLTPPTDVDATDRVTYETLRIN